MVTKSQIKATRKYNNKVYQRLNADIKKEYYNLINIYCDRYNISKASLIVKSIFYIIENNIDINNYEIKQEVIEELLNNNS